MSASEWLGVLRRRWQVVAIALLCTLVAALLVHKRPIYYQACASMLVSAPITQISPNVYNNPHNSLIAATGIVTEQLMSDQVKQRLQASGLTAVYVAQVHNTGSSETPAYGEPLTDICSSSYNSGLALRTTQALMADFSNILRARQVAVDVPAKSYMTDTVLAPAAVQAGVGKPSQALVGVLVFGVIFALALPMWVDRFLRRGQNRFDSRPGGGSLPPPPAQPITVPSTVRVGRPRFPDSGR